MPASALLDPDEILHVMAATGICYAACVSQGAPYILPLGFVLTDHADVLLRLRRDGRAHNALRCDPHICLAFSLLEGNHADSVLLEGAALLLPPDEADRIPVLVRTASVSGRRFPIAGLV